MARARAQLRSQSPFVVRPYRLASSRHESLAAVVCALTLAAIAVAELATPNDVVGVMGFLPIMAAMWTLSSRFAAAVGLFAVACFGVVLINEVANRPTVVCVGAVGLAVALTVRLYATRLSISIGGTPVRAVGWSEPWNVTAPTGVDSLTPRELEVARLAARGFSSLEIGSQLHISERTAESHLANAYAKLGIHSRSALRRIGAGLPEK